MLSVAAPVAFLYLLYTLISTIRVLYYHPLSRIPGPTLWIAFPIFRHLSSIRGRQDIDLRALHQKYGEVVRFAPDEVSFITAQAWRDIYGHGHKQLPKFQHSAVNRLDIISSNDVDHSRYRKAMSHAFSAKGLQAQEPILRKYVDKLITKLEHEAESRSPVDMVKWYNLTTFDLIGDLAFGQSFGGLENSQYHFWVSTIFDSIRVIPFVKVKDIYPMFFQLIKPFMPSGLANARQRQQDYSKTVVQKRLTNPESSDLVDFMDSMLRHRGEKDGLSDEELVANSSILVVAGSETTATLLSGVTFLLLKNPAAMKKLTDEVRSVMQTEEEITFANATANLPYMLACLEEAFRRYPPVPTGLQRVTTSTTIISGYEIPPNVRSEVYRHSRKSS
jgi:cytochrome P450